MRGRLFGPKRLLRVDLHGVSQFAGGDEHTLVRWEWIEAIELDRGSVVVRGGQESVVLPSGVLVPVEVRLDNDPLLRLEPFSPALASAVTEVDCGVPVRNIGRRSEGLDLSDLASADACREAAGQRAATAVGAVAVIGLLGLVTRAGSSERKVAVA